MASGFRVLQEAEIEEQQRYFEISATTQGAETAVKTAFRINQRLLKGCLEGVNLEDLSAT